MIKEIEIPENVSVEIEDKKVKVSGEKGTLEKEFKYFWDIKIEKKNNKIVVSSNSDRRKVKATVGSIGSIVAHINNMIKGVTKGFVYKLKIVYSHFPIKVRTEGDKVIIQNFLGERSPRIAKIMGDTKVEVKGQEVEVSGIDIEAVGQTAANIEQACRIRGKDRRVFQDGIFIVEKPKKTLV
jgi:large subunit ribosomal protein L6